MARLANALRLALGGATGALEGYGAKQERLRKDALLQQQQERQAMLDAAALRSEERQAIASGMIPGERFSRMTMPGATPMEAALRQTIGGKEYVYAPEINAAEKHRAGVMKERGERREQEKEFTTMGDIYEGLTIDGTPLIAKGQGRNIARLPINQQSSMIGTITRLAEARLRPQRPAAAPRGAAGPKPPSATDLTKETEGLSFLEQYANDQEVIKRVGAAIADNPALAERPGLIGYGILQDYKKRGTYTRGGAGRAPGGRVPTGRAPTEPPPGMGGATPTKPATTPADDPLRKFYDRGQR